MKYRARITVLTVILLLVFVVVGGVSAQETRSTEFYIATGVSAAGTCNGFSLSTHRYAEANRNLTILVIQNGIIFQDFAGSFGPANGTSSLTVFYQNSRGLAPVNSFPFAAGTKIDIIIGLWTDDWEPIYEWRARVKDCSNLALPLKKVRHGPAHVLTTNHSFEAIGLDSSGSPDATLPAFWKPKNAANDHRVCGGSEAYVGSCGLEIVSDPFVKSKFKNTYNGVVGSAGDWVSLHFYPQIDVGYSGGGKVKAKLYLVNGAVIALTRPIPTVAQNYGTPEFSWTKLPAAIQKAKVILIQAPGSGVYDLDTVTLAVFTNANGPRAMMAAPEGRSISVDNQ